MADIKYPRGECVWVSYYNSDKELLFIMTSKPACDFYFLYEAVNGEFKKLGKAKNPMELEEKFKIRDKMFV